MTKTDADQIRDAVRERYASAALAVQGSSCCPDGASGEGFGSQLYEDERAGDLPAGAIAASLGCGNPTMLASLEPGQVVLDLGSGGGIDVLLSARRVGPTGKVYGLDMTPEMLELANRNKAEAGVENVEFLFGAIEDIPLPDDSVDVIISNCVINLSTDKDKVLREAFRVLRSGGRMAVSDIVVRRELPEEVKRSMELWSGCIAGALLESEYVGKLKAAGFIDIEVEPTRVYTKEDASEMASSCCGGEAEATIKALDGAVMSAFIRAKKP